MKQTDKPKLTFRLKTIAKPRLFQHNDDSFPVLMFGTATSTADILRMLVLILRRSREACSSSFPLVSEGEVEVLLYLMLEIADVGQLFGDRQGVA